LHIFGGGVFFHPYQYKGQAVCAQAARGGELL